MPGPFARRKAGLSEDARSLLADAVDGLSLSGRGFDRALKVARTAADLAGAERIEHNHMAEALTFRALQSPSQEAAVG
jgi:magnesium chelatase family protein